MAVDGPGVLDSDLAADVHDAFFERYDAGADPTEVGEQLRATYARECLEDSEREIFLAALADCLWNVGAPVEELRGPIERLLAANAAFWGDLYPRRRAAISRLLTRLDTPKRTPLPRKKARLPRKLPFEEGDYLVFTKKNGKAVLVAVWAIEKRGQLRYDLVFPNLSRPAESGLVERLLSRPDSLSDDELATFFSRTRRARVTTIDHRDLKDHADRFRRVGNRPFAFPAWQGSSFSSCVTFADLERAADEAGSRALSAAELASSGGS